MAADGPNSVQRYAIRFDTEMPEEEPTNRNLQAVLGGIALPLPYRLVESVRNAVNAYRATPERAERLAAAEAGAKADGA